MSTVQRQHADDSLAVAGLLNPPRRGARRSRILGAGLARDGCRNARPGALPRSPHVGRTMPVAWTFVFAALVIGLLATKGMYRPTLDLWMLDAIRSIVVAVAIAAALTIALRALVHRRFVDRRRDRLEPWLLSTAFLIAGRIWLISSERRARRRGEAGQRALIVGAGNVGRLVAKRLARASRGGAETGRVPRQGAAVRRRRQPAFLSLAPAGTSSRIVRDKRIEHVIVTFSTAPEEVLLRLLKRCERLGIATSHRPSPVREVDRARHGRPSRRRPAHCAPLS